MKLETINQVFMDFEFGKTNQRYVSLICGCLIYYGKTHNFDLRKEKGRSEMKKFISEHIPYNATLISYGISAEIRALFSLYKTSNLKDLPIKYFICLLREHRMLANHSKELLYGDMIGEDGKIQVRRFYATKTGFALDVKYMNLLNALFKFSKVLEPEHARAKGLYREICARCNPSEVELYISQIMEYCQMDTERLPQLYDDMLSLREKRLPNHYPADLAVETLRRGAYGALIAEKEQDGYHIDKDSFFNLRAVKPKLMEDICRKINERWPDKKPFIWNEKEKRFIFKKNVVIKYLSLIHI